MNKENLSLNKVIDLEKWAGLQESLSVVTKAAIVVVDYKGNPITNHSKCNKFCSLVRADSEIVKYCKKCDARGGLEAVRLNEPYIYLCHYNIVDIAIPIIIDGKYIGAVMAGQIKLNESKENDNLEQIVVTNNLLAKDALIKYQEYYEELPVMTYKEVKDIANMLFNLCNYLVDEALEKNLVADMYSEIINNHGQIKNNTLSGYTVKNIKNARKGISNALINSYVEKQSEESRGIKVSKTLEPAIEYIHKNKSEHITADKVAKVCHLSTSYFSRLFTKETGENFSTYVSRLKIEWSKTLLEETEMTINEISEELGFNESGYFIKVFKKYEGITPFIYRKYCGQK